ncbi:MAG: 4Fe-4S dicluster domain-containing protein [Thiohalocapsa sp.]
MGDKLLIDIDGLNVLMAALAGQGYRLVGPTIRDRAIVYDEIGGVGDLPAGWTDHQDGGSYRLQRRGDGALFGYASTPQSWKRHLHPPTETLWRGERQGDGFAVSAAEEAPDKFALIGARACDIHAIAIQDRVLKEGTYADPGYVARRGNLFVVAVNCGTAGGTCFCVSMGTGPAASFGFDLALTELLDGDVHRFLVEAGTSAGAALLAELPTTPAAAGDAAAAAAVVAGAAAQMGRAMPAAAEVPELLRRHLDHPRWEEVAGRCLTCGNCTMVCPTCFCTSVEDVTALDGAATERVRRWDSCFTMDFSYLHGGSVRASPRSRYRQWMTHKLSTWWDQFGTSGCVGCGRCITWCPVGIDITEEVAAIRGDSGGTERQA